MAKRTGAVIRLTDDLAHARRPSRPATARHYTNLYFSYNRPGTERAAHDRARQAGERRVRGTGTTRPPPFGRHAGPNYAAIRPGREPASRTPTQTMSGISSRIRLSGYDQG
ncbi:MULTISPECIES: hypothetical protein [Burkholderia]|uniref:hypothetical protein n=1 Tax=Burkholderia TaxID=32008 RepID=UPI001269AC52|nr:MULTISPECIES: hypothetical protein [Burkholderia]